MKHVIVSALCLLIVACGSEEPSVSVPIPTTGARPDQTVVRAVAV